MKARIETHEGVNYARPMAPAPGSLASAQAALDLIADAGQLGTQRLMLRENDFPAAFYDLKTGLAGAILQKFSNYGIKALIVGDFTAVANPRFRELIYESQRSQQLRFLTYEAEALQWLIR